MKRNIVFALAVIALSLVTAQACGPDFTADVFVNRMTPDKPEDFHAGKLGVLLPTFVRADLIAAYRVLNGGTLSADEQKAYPLTDPQSADQPIEEWRAERAKYAEAQPGVEQNRELKVTGADGSVQGIDYLNCPIDAFRNAVAALKVRAQAWGAKSPALSDWLKGQDAVFANCRGGNPEMPAAAPSGAPPLLKTDRAYQRAAAEFYAADFDAARKDFAAIAQDKGSPWQSLSALMVARCMVRQAFLNSTGSGDGGAATFNADLLHQAADQLRSLQANRPQGISAEAVQKLLDLVRLRIEPDKRAGELAAALSGPAPDQNYAQHLADLNWYLNNQFDGVAIREDSGEQGTATGADAYSKAFMNAEKVRQIAPLIDWLASFQSPAEEARTHAVEQWKKSNSAPWLLAALSKIQPGDAQAAALMAAAAKLPQAAPAWETATYYRLRLAIASGQAAQARAELDRVLPVVRQGKRDSSINEFLALRMAAAADMKEFLVFAPRKVIEDTSESASSQRECEEVMKDPKRVYDCSRQVGPVQFAPDAAAILNRQATLETLAQMASSGALPAELSRAVAMMGWTRAVLLSDEAAAAKFYAMIPQKLQQQAGAGTGFKSIMALARNPGLRPYLDEGVQRLYSYDFVESYRDNWWNSAWGKSDFSGTAAPLEAPVAGFLASANRADAAKQVDAIKKHGPATLDLGDRILDYVKAHPQDPDAPEALYLVLRMIRYGASDVDQDTAEGKQKQARIDALRKEAARQLRQKFATSPWTKKAAPFAG